MHWPTSSPHRTRGFLLSWHYILGHQPGSDRRHSDTSVSLGIGGGAHSQGCAGSIMSVPTAVRDSTWFAIVPPPRQTRSIGGHQECEMPKCHASSLSSRVPPFRYRSGWTLEMTSIVYWTDLNCFGFLFHLVDI